MTTTIATHAVNTTPVATVKGVDLDVYRSTAAHSVDYSNGGITSRHDQLVCVGVLTHPQGTDSSVLTRVGDEGLDRQMRSYPVSDNAVVLEVRTVGGPVLSLRPVTVDANGAVQVLPGVMAGGTYAYTPDSRLQDLVRFALADPAGYFYGAIAVHDRQE